MKITAKEEYGLRILVRIANCNNKDGMNINQLSEAEGITNHYIAKLTRLLRIGGFVNSTPGQKGGYILAKPANEIIIKDVLQLLGGAIYDKNFCALHSGELKLCTNSVDCAARSLWQMIQFTVNQLLEKVSLQDLTNGEKKSAAALYNIVIKNKISSNLSLQQLPKN